MALQRIARAVKRYWKESLGTMIVLAIGTAVRDPDSLIPMLLTAPALFLLIVVFFAAFVPTLEDLDQQRRADGVSDLQKGQPHKP